MRIYSYHKNYWLEVRGRAGRADKQEKVYKSIIQNQLFIKKYVYVYQLREQK